MAIPFRKTTGQASEPLCAYIHIVARPTSMQAGLLVATPSGIPKEFVYNSVLVPAGVLWPIKEVRQAAAVSLAHSLFEACVNVPCLLLVPRTLVAADLDPLGFAPVIPFAVVDDERLSWVGLEPSPTHAANQVAAELAERKLLTEPFVRVAQALVEVFGSQ